MRVLLDTQVFLWLHTTPERVGPPLLLLEDPSTVRLVSAVVGWEIAIKYRLGRLSLPSPPHAWVPAKLADGAMTTLAVEMSHVLAVAELPDHHRDPFDRLLVAQSRLLNVPLVTADRALAGYDIEVLLAG
ncbi:MAG: type II toxin-antitoxin system VapC family toxin [Acidimicrobiales bacterium]